MPGTVIAELTLAVASGPVLSNRLNELTPVMTEQAHAVSSVEVLSANKEREQSVFQLELSS